LIVQGLIDASFGILGWILSLLPSNLVGSSHVGWEQGALQLMSVGASFLPWDIIVVCLGNILVWVAVQLTISTLQFIVDFLPFF
jgi:hypothetical protein